MGSSRIRTEVMVDGHVVVPRGAATVRIEVVGLLHNDSGSHWAVGSSSPEREHAWQIFDERHRVVHRVAADSGRASSPTHPFAGDLIPARLFLRRVQTLQVPATKLRNGRRYTVRHVHWGHSGEAEFVAVHEPKRPAAKKAAPKKKRAVKRSTKGRKKTAKRRR